MTPAGSEHGYLALRISSRLERFVDANDFGRIYTSETGFEVATDPDSAFVSRERVEAAGKVAGYFPGAPDLAVEVVSPDDLHSEVVEKSPSWLDYGCRMVIVVEPERKVATVYRSLHDIHILTERDTLDGADVVIGRKLHISETFSA